MAEAMDTATSAEIDETAEPQVRSRMSRTLPDVARGIGWYVLLACAWAPGLLATNARFAAANFAAVALLTIPAMTFIRRSREGRLRALAAVQLRRPRATAAQIAAACVLCTSFAIAAQAAMLSVWPEPPQAPSPLDALAKQPFGMVATAIVIIFVAPLTEELTMRGRIQRAVERRYDTFAAVAVSAPIFAIIHGFGYRTPHYLMDGIIFGVAAAVTRSVWTSIAMHMAINVTSFTADANGVGIEHLLRAFGTAVPWLVAAASLAGLVVLARSVKHRGGMISRRAC
jgi:membrane protease YdiL (CAAX protease family)